MSLAGVILAASSGLLIVAGFGKIASPESLSRAANSVGLAVSYQWVRVVGGLEVLSVAAYLASPVVGGAMVALVGFTIAGIVLTMMVLRRVPQVACGCFGSAGDHPLGVKSIVFGFGVVLSYVALVINADEAPFTLRAVVVGLSALLLQLLLLRGELHVAASSLRRRRSALPSMVEESVL